MIEDSSIVGYYGKIPSKGDFITKALPRSFVDPWDLWLRDALANSKIKLGDDWMECYLTTPLYQFVLSPGVCGNQVWLGVMMPCVDSVGRYFPMTICKTFSDFSNPLNLIESNSEWFERVEKLLLTCLDDDFSLPKFEELLSQLDSDDDESTITLKKTSMHRYQDSAWNFPVHEKEELCVIYPELVSSMLNTFYSSYSIWRTNGSDTISPSFVISEGLPPHESITAFMDGQWAKWGWTDEQIIR